MDSAWVGAISALGGVFVGALAETWRASRAFKREKGWSLIDERRERLERLYEALDDLSSWYGRSLALAIVNLGGGGDTSTLAEPADQIPWARMRMLVHFYFPEFIPLLADVERLGPGTGEAIGLARIEESRDPEILKRHMADLSGTIGALYKATSAMKRAIVTESQAIAARRVSATT